MTNTIYIVLKLNNQKLYRASRLPWLLSEFPEADGLYLYWLRTPLTSGKDVVINRGHAHWGEGTAFRTDQEINKLINFSLRRDRPFKERT